jgi:hypothetical protein
MVSILSAIVIIIIVLLAAGSVIAVPVLIVYAIWRTIHDDQSSSSQLDKLSGPIKDFNQVAAELSIVQSGVSKDTVSSQYDFLYDFYVLARGALPWQTTTKPTVYINPYRKRAAEIALKADCDLPLIQLESKKNGTRIPSKFYKKGLKMVSVDLEGNFNKYFKLKCEAGQEIIALQVINPALMQHIIDTQQFYDVQIYGSSIYVTTDLKKWTKEFVESLIDHARSLKKIAETVQKVTDSRID